MPGRKYALRESLVKLLTPRERNRIKNRTYKRNHRDFAKQGLNYDQVEEKKLRR